MNRNRKGPQNNGPQTGKKMGFCAGYNSAANNNAGRDIDFGQRKGRGCKNRGRFNNNGQGNGFGNRCKGGQGRRFNQGAE